MAKRKKRRIVAERADRTARKIKSHKGALGIVAGANACYPAEELRIYNTYENGVVVTYRTVTIYPFGRLRNWTRRIQECGSLAKSFENHGEIMAANLEGIERKLPKGTVINARTNGRFNDDDAVILTANAAKVDEKTFKDAVDLMKEDLCNFPPKKSAE